MGPGSSHFHAMGRRSSRLRYLHCLKNGELDRRSDSAQGGHQGAWPHCNVREAKGAHHPGGEALVEAAVAVGAEDVAQALAVALPSQRHVRAQRLHRICHHRPSRPRGTPCSTPCDSTDEVTTGHSWFTRTGNRCLTRMHR